MPNWAMASMSVVLPTRNAKAFQSLFLGDDEKENEGKKEYFARTFLNQVVEEKNDKGMSLLHIDAQCAWSVGSCLIDKRESEEGKPIAITLEEAIRKCEVKRLTLYSNEPGIGFEETALFDLDKGDEVYYESRETYRDPYCDFLDTDDVDEKENEGGDRECQIG